MNDIRMALADQLRRAAEGEAWHGPSVREALDGVAAADAAQHPIAGAHSIWEIVLHLRGTHQLVLRRIAGSEEMLLPLEDWPAVPESTEENWRRDISAYYELNARTRSAIAEFPMERLYEPLIANPPYTAITQFAGLTQHDLYHAGQIVLLKRALKR